MGQTVGVTAGVCARLILVARLAGRAGVATPVMEDVYGPALAARAAGPGGHRLPSSSTSAQPSPRPRRPPVRVSAAAAPPPRQSRGGAAGPGCTEGARAVPTRVRMGCACACWAVVGLGGGGCAPAPAPFGRVRSQRATSGRAHWIVSDAAGLARFWGKGGATEGLAHWLG